MDDEHERLPRGPKLFPALPPLGKDAEMPLLHWRLGRIEEVVEQHHHDIHALHSHPRLTSEEIKSWTTLLTPPVVIGLLGFIATWKPALLDQFALIIRTLLGLH